MKMLIMIVLEISGAYGQQLQRRMVNSFNKRSNNSSGVSFTIMKLRPDYDSCPCTIAFSAASTKLHTRFRLTNPLLLLPLIKQNFHEIYPAAAGCCDIDVGIHCVIQVFPMKLMLHRMASSISGTGTFEERKIHMQPYYHPFLPQKSWFGQPFIQDDLFCPFRESKLLLQRYGHFQRIYCSTKCLR